MEGLELMRKKGLFSMLVCTCLCVILTAGCSAPQNSGSPSPTAPSETGAGSTGGVETPLQTDGGENYIPPDWQYDLNVEEDMQYSYNIEDQFIPFWERNVMYNEERLLYRGERSYFGQAFMHAREYNIRARLVAAKPICRRQGLYLG